MLQVYVIQNSATQKHVITLLHYCGKLRVDYYLKYNEIYVWEKQMFIGYHSLFSLIRGLKVCQLQAQPTLVLDQLKTHSSKQ